MRGILAIGLACLLSVTAPVYAADLAMPVKAPPVEAPPPPEFDATGLLIAAVVIGIGVCIALCPSHHGRQEVGASPGGGA